MVRAVKKPAKPPRYHIIAAKLQSDIRRGRYPVGTLLPAEMKLCGRFRASRHTMRAALRVITERGLITRRAGAGSVVVAADQPVVFTHCVGSLAEWMKYPPDTYRETVCADKVRADRRLAALLKCEVGKAWFRISSVRRSDQHAMPLAWTDIYVLPKYAGVARRGDHARTPVHQQIEKMYGETVDRAQLEMFAGRISARLARVLKVRPGTAVMTMVRRYWGEASGNFEITVAIHPQERYVYTLELTRQFKSQR
jgi:GntR family transcriptional regulator